MKNINEEIVTLLHYFYKQQSFNNGDSFSLLKEEHGLNDSVYEIAKGFEDAIKEAIDKNRTPFTLTLTQRDCTADSNVITSVAKYILIEIDIRYRDSKESIGSLAYNRDRMSFSPEENRFNNIYINGTFKVGHDNYITCIIGLLAHELTHAFDNLSRERKLNGKNLWDRATKDGLGRIGYDNSTMDKAYLNAILYQTSTVERNAYVANIISDIKPYLPYCSSSKEAMECLNKHSTTWRNRVLTIDDYMPKFDMVSNPSAQKYLINHYNFVTGKNITTYKQFLKHINFRWNKFKKKLVYQLSKQITDIAFKNPQWKGLTIDTNDKIF